jgi:hypothetical protein
MRQFYSPEEIKEKTLGQLTQSTKFFTTVYGMLGKNRNVTGQLY